MASGQRAVGEGSGGLRPTTHVAGGGGSARGEYFRCKTCSKTFTSFQALGGHRTGHTRMAARQRQEHGAAGAAVVGATNNQRRVVSAHQWHLCAVCGVEFRMGQALGGHMRRHRAAAGDVAAPRVKTDDVVVGDECTGGICLDLNLTPSENCDKCRHAQLGVAVNSVQRTILLDRPL